MNLTKIDIICAVGVSDKGFALRAFARKLGGQPAESTIIDF